MKMGRGGKEGVRQRRAHLGGGGGVGNVKGCCRLGLAVRAFVLALQRGILLLPQQGLGHGGVGGGDALLGAARNGTGDG